MLPEKITIIWPAGYQHRFHEPVEGQICIKIVLEDIVKDSSGDKCFALVPCKNDCQKK